MDNEYQNRIATAKLKGEITAICGKNEAMESRIDVNLTKMRADMEKHDKENWVVGFGIA